MNYFAYQVGSGEGNFHIFLQVAGKNYTMYDFAKNSRNVRTGKGNKKVMVC